MDLLTDPTKGMEGHHKRRFKMTGIKNLNMKEYLEYDVLSTSELYEKISSTLFNITNQNPSIFQKVEESQAS